MTHQEWIEKLTQEGYKEITVCPNAPNATFPEHTHHEPTVHIILEGEFTLTEKGRSITHKVGDRFEIPAGTAHTAMCGPTGCTFIVGIKE
ncbi:MAG: cupin domain-containing protein [Candidatus Andersenbacteria bacterium]|nr:cupin domain-containing protein [Candidatus Andersenbacteria bacterium]